jgi:hypothetical protein
VADLPELQAKLLTSSSYPLLPARLPHSGREDRSTPITKCWGKDEEESDLRLQAPKKKKKQQILQEHYFR